MAPRRAEIRRCRGGIHVIGAARAHRGQNGLFPRRGGDISTVPTRLMDFSDFSDKKKNTKQTKKEKSGSRPVSTRAYSYNSRSTMIDQTYWRYRYYFIYICIFDLNTKVRKSMLKVNCTVRSTRPCIKAPMGNFIGKIML